MRRYIAFAGILLVAGCSKTDPPVVVTPTVAPRPIVAATPVVVAPAPTRPPVAFGPPPGAAPLPGMQRFQVVPNPHPRVENPAPASVRNQPRRAPSTTIQPFFNENPSRERQSALPANMMSLGQWQSTDNMNTETFTISRTSATMGYVVRPLNPDMPCLVQVILRDASGGIEEILLNKSTEGHGHTFIREPGDHYLQISAMNARYTIAIAQRR